MGISHAHDGRRLAPAFVLVAFALLALFVAFGLAPSPAAAFSSYQHGGASCGSCHTGAYSDPVLDTSCTTCHTGGFTTPAGSGKTCASAAGCHAPNQDMSAQQTAAGCSTGAAGATCHNGPAHIGSTTKGCTSCHGTVTSVTNPGRSAHHVSADASTVSALLTIKLSGASVKVKKTIKASGLVKPVRTGYVVTTLIQKKNSKGKWVKVTTKKSTPNATTNGWSLSYKPLKKGSYRMQSSVPAVTGVLAGKTAFKTFKVK